MIFHTTFISSTPVCTLAMIAIEVWQKNKEKVSIMGKSIFSMGIFVAWQWNPYCSSSKHHPWWWHRHAHYLIRDWTSLLSKGGKAFNFPGPSRITMTVSYRWNKTFLHPLFSAALQQRRRITLQLSQHLQSKIRPFTVLCLWAAPSTS